MKIHLVAFPHRRVDVEQVCGFSAKAARFRDMLTARGHEVMVYDGEDTPEADEWNPAQRMWKEYNASLVQRLRYEDGIICLATGHPHGELVQALPGRTFVEYAIGYRGVLPEGTHHVFESYAWQHWVNGRMDRITGRRGDTVICNFYPAEEFPLGEDDGYLLFVGRGVASKGTATAIEIANRSGLPLVAVGSGEWPLGVDHRGFVSLAERNKLMSNARAVLCLTDFFEPGCSVAHEALMTGAPVICSDWGCFPETVTQGSDGFRCSTMAEMVERVHIAGKALNRKAIQLRAQKRWSYTAVAPQFESYFERLG